MTEDLSSLQTSLFSSLWREEKLSARSQQIYCCGCEKMVEARLTSGKEIYPSRKDLWKQPYWQCSCGLYVGCHKGRERKTVPLGVIPTRELRVARSYIHAVLDPPWKTRKFSRAEVYSKLSAKLGYSYHTAEIRTIEEARIVYRKAKEVIAELALNKIHTKQ